MQSSDSLLAFSKAIQQLLGGLLDTVGVHRQLFVSIFAWEGIKVPYLLDVLAVPWRPRISNKYSIEREVLHDTVSTTFFCVQRSSYTLLADTHPAAKPRQPYAYWHVQLAISKWA